MTSVSCINFSFRNNPTFWRAIAKQVSPRFQRIDMIENNFENSGHGNCQEHSWDSPKGALA